MFTSKTTICLHSGYKIKKCKKSKKYRGDLQGKENVSMSAI